MRISTFSLSIYSFWSATFNGRDNEKGTQRGRDRKGRSCKRSDGNKRKEKRKLPRLSRFGRQWRKRKLGMQLKTSLLIFPRVSSLYPSVVALFYFWQRTLTTRLKNPPFLAGLCYFLTSTVQTNHYLTGQTSRALFSQDGHVFPKRCQPTIILVISFLSLSPSRSFFPPSRDFPRVHF